MRRKYLYLAFVMLATLVPAAGRAQTAPVPVINEPLVPTAVAPGRANFILSVNGTGFVPGAVVKWNGIARTTTFVSSSRLAAAILASDVASAGTATVTVVNPGSGSGVTSAPTFFLIGPPTPSQDVSFNADTIPGITIQRGSVTTADLNRDGKQDLILWNSSFSSATGGTSIFIFLGNGDGTFQAPITMNVPNSNIHAIKIADLNNDGIPDLFIAAAQIGQGLPSEAPDAVLLGNGDGTFQSPIVAPSLDLAGITFDVAIADINKDGKLDAVLSKGGYVVLLGNGDGTFSAQKEVFIPSPGPTLTGLSLNTVALADVNGDGNLDLVALAMTGVFDLATLVVLPGNGDGTFNDPIFTSTLMVNGSPVVGFGSMAVADFNGDGKTDVAVYINAHPTGSVQVFLGNGDGTFQQPIVVPGAEGATGSLIAGDFNNDGKLDLAAGNILFFGQGDGSFPTSIPLPLPLPGISSGPILVAADFNGDGRLDLANAFTSSFVTSSATVLTQVPNLPPPDFTGTIGPLSATVQPGGSASFSFHFSALDGFSGDVALSVNGLPMGASASITPVMVDSSVNVANITVTTDASIAPGSYPFFLTGSSGSIVHRLAITLNVNSSPGDFSGKFTPSSSTVVPGNGTTFDFQFSPLNGFTGDVALSMTGLPAGAMASFTPAMVNASTPSSTITISTTSTTPLGAFPITLVGTSGGIVHKAAATLYVNPSLGDFTGSLTPTPLEFPVPGPQGSFGSYTFTLVPLDGFTGDVNLSVSDLPPGVTATIRPSATIKGGSGQATITIVTPPAISTPVPPDVVRTYSFLLTGTSGGLVHKMRPEFTVVAPDFHYAVSPSETVVQGQETQYLFILLSNSPVDLSVSGLPPGTTLSFDPFNGHAPLRNSQVKLDVFTSSATPPGTYTLTLTVTSIYGVVNSNTMTLTVTAAP